MKESVLVYLRAFLIQSFLVVYVAHGDLEMQLFVLFFMFFPL